MFKIITRYRALTLGFLALFVGIAHAQNYSVTIMPQAPENQELVRLRVNWIAAYPCLTASVAMAQNNITVALRCELAVGTLGPDGWSDVDLGRFPAGTYTVTVVEADAPLIPAINKEFVTTERHTFLPPYLFPVADFTDHWWNPQEPGWGISIMQHVSDRLFAVWFVYGPTGQPVWYTLQPGNWTYQTSYTGPIYRTTGPYFAGPFDSSQVVLTQVGSGTLTFTDSTSGTFSYTIDGVSGSKPIARLPF